MTSLLPSPSNASINQILDNMNENKKSSLQDVQQAGGLLAMCITITATNNLNELQRIAQQHQTQHNLTRTASK